MEWAAGIYCVGFVVSAFCAGLAGEGRDEPWLSLAACLTWPLILGFCVAFAAGETIADHRQK